MTITSVTVGIGEERLERSEAADAGEHLADHGVGIGPGQQRREGPHQAGHLLAVDLGAGRTGEQRAVHLVFHGPAGDGAHAASGRVRPRSARSNGRGIFDASTPASTVRAMAGSHAISARTGAPTTVSTSWRVSARPGSTTRTMPDGRIGAATTRRSAR